MGDFFQRKTTEKIRKFDLNAPRVRKTFYNTLNRDLYKEFVKENPDTKVTWEKFEYIIRTSTEVMVDIVCSHREGVDMLNSLGKLMIGACNKKKDKNYDWVLSSKHEKNVEHKNWESNKYLCKIFYSSFETKYKFPLINHWTFKPSRFFQRAASKAFRLNWNFFWKVPPLQKIGKLKEQGIRSIKMIKNEKKGKRMDFSDTQPI